MAPLLIKGNWGQKEMSVILEGIGKWSGFWQKGGVDYRRIFIPKPIPKN